MPIPKNEFWGDNSYKNPPFTEALLTLAEQSLGVKLPEEYIDLLRIQNGGFTLDFGFPTTLAPYWSRDHAPLEELAGINPDLDNMTPNILATEYMTEEWGLPPRQVLLAGDGRWWVTLDYRGGDTPTVAWIDVEMEQDVTIAGSFAEFFAGLRPVSEFESSEDI